MPALQVMQSWLDDMSAATLAGDWDIYLAHVSLPFHLVTETSTSLVATEAELREGFDQFGQMLQTLRVTDYIRLGESAAEIGSELIAGRYITHLMSGSHRILPPYRSQVTLRREGNHWRAASIVNALKNTQWPIGTPAVATHFDGRREPE